MPAQVGPRGARPLLEAIAGVLWAQLPARGSQRAELEKRRLSGACYACLNKLVQYDLFHLECPQHGRRATHKQRTDKAF